jgi:hypothetical protein
MRAQAHMNAPCHTELRLNLARHKVLFYRRHKFRDAAWDASTTDTNRTTMLQASVSPDM